MIISALENLTLEELEEVQTKTKNLIDAKKVNLKPQLVVYTHYCKTSSDYHKRKYKHWAKLVRAVDTTKTNGYAFIGDFLNINYEHKIPVGSIVVQVCHVTLIAYKATADGLEKISEARTHTMSGFIDELAKMF